MVGAYIFLFDFVVSFCYNRGMGRKKKVETRGRKSKIEKVGRVLELPIVGSGNIYGRGMTPVEKNKRSLLKRMAKEAGIALEDLPKYNVFGPELEIRKFIKTLVESNGELDKAMRVYLPSSGKWSLDERMIYGLKMVQSKRGKELIEEAFQVMGLDTTNIIKRIDDIAKGAKRDSDKLKALELLGKFRNLFEDGRRRKEGDVYNNLYVTEDAAVRILERRNKHKIGAGGKFIDDSGEERTIVDGEEVVD
jgi:hypothetical protein